MNGWKAIKGVNRMAMDFGATAMGLDGMVMVQWYPTIGQTIQGCHKHFG